MPELRECVAAALHIARFQTATPATALVVRELWADPTEEERVNALKDSRWSRGLVDVLTDTNPAVRGMAPRATAQDAIGTGRTRPILYPAQWVNTGVHISQRDMVLQPVTELNHRNVVLNFGTTWCQIRPLSHTSVQIFTKEIFEASVKPVPCTVRGYRIALAFEFDTHVISLHTLDLVMSVFWASARDGLRTVHLDVYLQFDQWISRLIAWVIKRRASKSSRCSFAIQLVRDAEWSDVFCGIGMYTVNEIWHTAGLPADITEQELFDCCSRMARFVCSVYTYSFEARERIWKLYVRKRINKDFLIAATREHCAEYSTYLSVYGQDRCYMSQRLKLAVEDREAAIAKLAAGRAQISGGYFRCGPKSGVYDAFEPTLVRQALIDHPYLGALVFGHKAWSLLRPPVTGNAATATTAALQLQEYFFPGLNTGIVYLAPHTWLDVTHFLTDGLFIAQGSRLLRKCSVPVHLLHIDGSTDVWYDANTLAAAMSKIQPAKAEVRKSKLLDNIVMNTNKWAVGPLHFCGVATIEKASGGGQNHVLVCEGDAAIPAQILQRHALSKTAAGIGAKRAKAKADARVKNERRQQKGLPPVAPKKIIAHDLPDYKKRVAAISSEVPMKTATRESNAETQDPPKRRRVTGDRYVMEAASATVLEPRRLRTRRVIEPTE